MIWQQNVSVIVALVLVNEDGKVRHKDYNCVLFSSYCKGTFLLQIILIVDASNGFFYY